MDAPLVLAARGLLMVRAAIVPTAAARENAKLAADNGVRYFRHTLHVAAEPVMVVDTASAADARLARRLRQAALIYLTGGDPAYLVATLRGSRAWQAIEEAYAQGAVLAGASAGAMALCELVWRPGRDDWEAGLGLVQGIALIPHFAEQPAERIQKLRLRLPEAVTLVGVDEMTALQWRQGTWRVAGRGTVAVYAEPEPVVYHAGNVVDLPPPYGVWPEETWTG
jgi:cyanophycinase